MPDQIPAKVVTEEGALLHFPSLGVGQDFVVVTSFPTDTVERRSKVLELIEGEANKAEDIMGMPFMLQDFICHPIQLESAEGGEIVDAVRTILIDADGNPVACVSQGVLKSLQRIGWAVGRMPPWVPPIKVKLVQRSTGKGRRTYKLVPVEGG